MNIIEAFQGSKKITGSLVRERGSKYWRFNNDGDVINDKGQYICISKKMLEATDYEFYEEEIRPKEAGELWTKDGVEYFLSRYEFGNDICRISSSGKVAPIEKCTDMIHGQNGWRRTRPIVQDNNYVKWSIALNTTPKQETSNGKT